MVAFSADYPPDGAISFAKCCWAEDSYTLLYFGGVFTQLVCAHAQIGGREGVRSDRKSQDCLILTAVLFEETVEPRHRQLKMHF